MKKMNLNHLAISLIELDPENISDLDGFKKSLALNGLAQCYVHVIGLGSEERKITLARGLTFMGSLYDSVSGGSGAIGEECLVTRLDDYRMDNHLPPPQFVKMDIEGAEIEAIKGATDFLKNHNVNFTIANHVVNGDHTYITIEAILTLSLLFSLHLYNFRQKQSIFLLRPFCGSKQHLLPTLKGLSEFRHRLLTVPD